MLSPTVDPTQLGFEDTSELDPLTDIIGQERAVEALEFGLSMKSQGYNLYVSGPVGTGKATLASHGFAVHGMSVIERHEPVLML